METGKNNLLGLLNSVGPFETKIVNLFKSYTLKVNIAEIKTINELVNLWKFKCTILVDAKEIVTFYIDKQSEKETGKSATKTSYTFQIYTLDTESEKIKTSTNLSSETWENFLLDNVKGDAEEILSVFPF